MAIAFRNGRIHPSTCGIATAEDIIEVHADGHLLNTKCFLHLGGIAEVEVRHTVTMQGTVGILRVVEILTRHIVSVPHGLPTLMVKGKEPVQDRRG